MTSPVAPPRALLSIAVHLSFSGPEAAPDAVFCRRAVTRILDDFDAIGSSVVCPEPLVAIKAALRGWAAADELSDQSRALSRLQFEVGRYYARAAADHVQAYIGGPSA
ncbi:hypothetical protein [Citreimonas sp.]|uniref:hypothetical protein n=1 Tax=Citreimonas sp. TaxID=3036715 RepID=UPI00405917A5